jgi:hypothetical protein
MDPITLQNFTGQNWLITPAALAVGEPRPASIYHQKWLLVLSGVVDANLEGNSTAEWLQETVSINPLPLVAVPNPTTTGPLNWAISHYSIPRPPGTPGNDYNIVFSLEPGGGLFASLSSIFNQNQSINSGFAVNTWRPTHQDSGIDILTNQSVNNIFTGINVDVAIRDTDAWILRIGYNITLVGTIAFIKVPVIF